MANLNKNSDDVFGQDSEGKELTFGQICHRIWKGKIPFIATTVGVAVATLLGLHYFYTVPTRTYTAYAHYSFKGAENDVYPDGTPFDYLSLISASTLSSAKDSDASFSNIDTSAIVNKGDVSIKKVGVSTLPENATTTVTVYKSNYLALTIKAKYFSSSEQASQFFSSILSIPVNKASEQYGSFTYTANLNNANAAVQYDTQISLLNSQYKLIISTYDSLIESFGDVTIISDDKSSSESLSEFKDESILYFANGSTRGTTKVQTETTDKTTVVDNNYDGTTSNSIVDLQNIVNSKGYVKNYSAFQSQAQSMKDSYENLITQNNAHISALKQDFKDLYGTGTSKEVSAIETKITELEGENATYQSKIDALDKQLTNGSTPAPESFTSLLSTYSDKLKTYTATLAKNSKQIYTVNNTVSFDNPGVVGPRSGGFNVGIEILIAALAGLLVGSITGYAVGKNRENKEMSNIPSESVAAK
jgi:hypothetical protein